MTDMPVDTMSFEKAFQLYPSRRWPIFGLSRYISKVIGKHVMEYYEMLQGKNEYNWALRK